ncbi:MAG: hypothetical protein ONB23_10145 [candidate division KSB1 bacterium]|nr:hypothetical protein [candidate division KSB1 bacterium]
MRRFLAVLVMGGILSLLGCYTTLRHPVFRSENDEPLKVSPRDDCWSCHSARAESFWPVEVPPSAAGYYAWEFYYGIPWWQEEGASDQAARAEEPLPQPRDFRRRGVPEAGVGAPAVQQPEPTIQGVARKTASEPQTQPSEVSPSADSRRSVARRDTTTSEAVKEARRQPRP